MTRKHSFRRLVCSLTLLGLAGCDLAFEPYEGQPAEQALSSIEGLRAATVGNYSLLTSGGYNGFTKLLFELNEYPADNVSLSGTTSSPLFFVYNYAHSPNMGYIDAFWRISYQLIFGANQVLENIEDSSAEMDQLRGENLFLRALAHYQLVNVFARPYVQGRDNPGIPVIRSTEEAAGLPARATVGEVYTAVVDDLQKAAELMTIPRTSSRASREAAYALLSRVYLNMGENAKAVEAADRVINSGRYQLADTEEFITWPTRAPEANPGIIFAIKHTVANDQGWGALGSLYYKSPGGVGWGEMYASRSYRELLAKHPEDARNAFVVPNYQLDKSGNIVRDAAGNPVLQARNGFPQYFVNKFSNQEGNVTLSSPAILRLAEVYLNRAEANAKLGNLQAAIEDVNRVRRRAGLSGDALYSVGNLKGHASVLDVVLEERRLELAFEGHRKYDLLRNNRPVVRNYPGTHLNPGNVGVDMAAGTQIVPADHARMIFFVPENEVGLNSNLKQNP